MQVTKRNGTTEPFNLDKIHRIVTWATEGINDVSVSDIEMNAQLSFSDGVKTDVIHKVLIKSANNLTSEDSPNYQYVAARLALYALRKDVWRSNEPPRLFEHITKCVNLGIYDAEILQMYSESEIMKLNKIVKHNRDEDFTYAGLQQMIDKYLIKNRDTGEIYETPQFAYLLIAMTCFSKYPAEKRMEYVKKCYDHFSTFKINLATPIVSGVRSTTRQYASCILIDVDDSLDSIFASASAAGKYTGKRAGIGLNAGRIRPIGSTIRGGEVISTGLIPYLKLFESAVKSTSQNGIRGGSATVSVPFWHSEIEDTVVLKNNSGTDDNRVRKLDYCIQFSRLFYERVMNNEDITLFSPYECKKLYDLFGHPGFDEEYEKQEKNTKLKFRKRINARKFAELFSRERLETGRIYIMNIDHVNEHGAFEDSCKMTNLCVEITHPTVPLNSLEDENAEIGVCVLSAINMVETKKEEYPEVCDVIVRLLDELIDYQDYVVNAAKNFCINRRSLGIGFTNLAGFLAKHKLSYDSSEALYLLDEYAEALQYNLLNASADLAKEKGACAKFDRTKYASSVLPIDTYKKDVDSLVKRDYSYDWEALRNKISETGLRHSTVTAQMPCESSSVIQNSTNGIEPVRELISYKKAKTGVLKQVVPGFSKYGKYYTKAFDIKSNTTYTNVAAVLQKWFDMSISMNHYYNYEHYPEGNIPLSAIIKDMIYSYRMGIKTIYYSNTPDGDAEVSCAGGSCAI